MRLTWLHAALLALLAALFYMAGSTVTKERERPPPQASALSEKGRERLEAWASVSRAKAIGQGEELVQIRIPSETTPGLPQTDDVCLLYKNLERGFAAMHCSD